MMTFTELPSVSADRPTLVTDLLRLAVAAYLARFTGPSRQHTESDLRCYLSWCAERGLDPLTTRRPHLEQYLRWMQEIRHFKPSTVSRRFSVAAGFYRTCVIDGLLEHSPAEHVRRPAVSAESPTLGFTHLQFEGLLTAARQSTDRCDFALVAMLGLLGLRIFEATGADTTDLGEEHGHRVLRVCGKGTKLVLIPLPPAVARASTGPSAPGPAARSCSTAAEPGWTATPPPAGCGAWPAPPASKWTERTRSRSRRLERVRPGSWGPSSLGGRHPAAQPEGDEGSSWSRRRLLGWRAGGRSETGIELAGYSAGPSGLRGRLLG